MTTNDILHKVKINTWSTKNTGQSDENLETLMGMLVRNQLEAIGLEDIALEFRIGCEGPHERVLIIDAFGIMDDMAKAQWEVSGGIPDKYV